MTRELLQIQNVIELDEIFPFFAVDLEFGTEVLDFGGEALSSRSLHFWTGLGEIQHGGYTYTGAGQFLSVSDVTETADLRAAGAVVSLSGLPSEIVALALQQPYQGRVCRIKFGMLNANNNKTVTEDGIGITLEDTSDIDNTAGDPAVMIDMFVGYMDQMNIEENPDSSTIALSVENKLVDLQRSKTSRYTSEFQKKKYRDAFPSRSNEDRAFDFVNDLQGKRLNWGRD
tara:strand:- start:4535 stop:5221 length:687 start_codon:yes stop_codon:yes gene_type:complete